MRGVERPLHASTRTQRPSDAPATHRGTAREALSLKHSCGNAGDLTGRTHRCLPRERLVDASSPCATWTPSNSGTVRSLHCIRTGHDRFLELEKMFARQALTCGATRRRRCRRRPVPSRWRTAAPQHSVVAGQQHWRGCECLFGFGARRLSRGVRQINNPLQTERAQQSAVSREECPFEICGNARDTGSSSARDAQERRGVPKGYPREYSPRRQRLARISYAGLLQSARGRTRTGKTRRSGDFESDPRVRPKTISRAGTLLSISQLSTLGTGRPFSASFAVATCGRGESRGS